MIRKLLLAGWLSLAALPAAAATFYIQTTGSATNSGSTDTDAATVSGATSTQATLVVTLSGTPNLSGVVTTVGPTQSTVFLTGSTATNKKIFKITAVDDGADTVTVDTDPACAGNACGAWAIGGRQKSPDYNPLLEGSLGPGDTVIMNDTPASRATTFMTSRANGDSTAGQITFKGKDGVMPTLTVTSTPSVISLSHTNWTVMGIIATQTGASGDGIGVGNSGYIVYNVKVTDAGGDCIDIGGAIGLVANSELSGCGGHGINSSGSSTFIGNNIHGNTLSGIAVATTTGSMNISNNLIWGNTQRGILISGAFTAQNNFFSIYANTIYGNVQSGVEVTDADASVTLINNIIQENGASSGHYNVEFVAGMAEFHAFHGYNLLYHSNCQGSGTGGTGAATTCVLNFIPHSTDIVGTSAAFTNAGAGNFSIPSSSLAYKAGIPGVFLGGTSTGYPSIGAVEPNPTSTGGGRCIGC